MHFSLKRLTSTSWRIALAAVVLAVIGGYFLFGRGTNLGATLVIAMGDFRKQVSVSGTVTAAKDVDLGFAANGRVAGVYASVGQHVAAGAILAEIENADLAALLAQAEANLASLLAGTRSEELAVAATTVANAEASLIDAIQNAYTISDDAVRNKTDTLFTNPRTNPNLSFTVTNAVLEASVERERTDIEAVLKDWASLVETLSSDTAAKSAKQSQTYLAQVTTFLADMNLALNQSIAGQSASVTTLATARTNVNTAAAALTNDAAALDAAESALALKQAGSAREAVAAQEAVVRSARASLAKTRVVAPFSGTVTRMDAGIGEIVSPTASAIALESDGVFQIETYVPEVSIAGVAVGNLATTTLDAYGASVFFAARVVAVDPAETVKDGVPTYKTTLAFLSADKRIRSGMTADVAIETGVLRDAIVIPAGAVGKKGGAPYVSVVERDSVAQRAVVTGASPSLGQAHILSGLSAGDVILLAPIP